MSIKKLKWAALAIILIGAFLFFRQYQQPKELTKAGLLFRPAGVGLPIRVQIPVLSINAAIEEVAVASDGAMAAPKFPFETAWYKLGPRPGETGNAVIAGHLDWKYGAKAVFTDLHNVKAGDKILVQDHQGTTITFIVRVIRIYSPNANTSEVFNSSDGKSHLNLVTCSGSWDGNSKAYTQRLVVFADKE